MFFLLALVCLVGSASAAGTGNPEYFEPTHLLPGIGAGRARLSDDIIARRAGRMIESQTFVILRDPHATAGAKRIHGPTLQRLFDKASSASGVPSSLIAAIAYLESWGDVRARSPAGPRGIMQISAGTARSMGLRIVYAKRYRTQTRLRRVRTSSGTWISRRVRERVPYRVIVRDDRLVSERAVPAAAKYLARLADKFGGLDWAVFAYHCGEGCAATMRSLTEQADGIQAPYTVAKMFFAANPALNRELYLAVRRHMERDYSPTYWFRVMRACQLLTLYRKDPHGFQQLAADYRNADDPKLRVPHRLALWFTRDHPRFQDGYDLNNEELVGSLDDPDYYGFRFRATGEEHPTSLASPSAVGALAYIAFETRRLHEAMSVEDERFVPLEASVPVTPLDSPAAYAQIGHSTGHVFDVDYGNLSPGQREALDFVLDELGWEGYLGFIRAAPDGGTLHIGCSPSARGFFESVYASAFDNTDVRVISGGG